jgi:hypothetical protein
MEACSVYENVRLIKPEFEFTNFDNLFKKVKGDKDE